MSKARVEITIQTRGYEIYIGDSKGEIGEFVGRTPVTFYVEPKETLDILWFKKYITVKKDGAVIKGCLGTRFILRKGPDVGDCWCVQEIAPPSGGIFIPHKGTETSLAFDIDDKWTYGWIDFYSEADRIDVYIDREHKGLILVSSLILYLAPGTYLVEQEAAGARCYANYYRCNGTAYYAPKVPVKAGERTIVDVDMYNSPITPPPQYVLDAVIRHLQEFGWDSVPLELGCFFASRKSQLTEEWCYTNNVPEVCGYEKATHYWLISNPGFVFPTTEICKVSIETSGYNIHVATQPGLGTPRPSPPVVFNCASICIGKDEYECTRYITLTTPYLGILYDAKVVFTKLVPGKWSIDRGSLELFDISSSHTTLVLTLKPFLNELIDLVLAYRGKKDIGFKPSLDGLLDAVRKLKV
jgi:hypothetical protein